MRYINIAITAIALAFSLTASAQKSKQDIHDNPLLAGTNYLAYPDPQKPLTAAPKGYKPFYISHYGRHGSRHLIGMGDYDRAFNTLNKAKENGKLTATGLETLKKVAMIREDARGRDGELTQRGAEQHKAIAKRMYERFPEVFKGDVTVDAKSTVVIRCILSMENALQQLLTMNPNLKVKHDASYHDMYYMNFDDKRLGELKRQGTRSKEFRDFAKGLNHSERLMKVLFNDQQYVKDSVNAGQTMDLLLKLARNIQSTELRHEISMMELFTEDEIYDMWKENNARWYVEYGSSPLSGGKQPFSQRFLLKKMIEEADSCMMYDRPGATLRYGHEVCVMPLVCLLDLNNYGAQYDDLSQLEKNGWYNYRIFPMGCNVQFIFYRPAKPAKASRELHGDVIFKVLLNEEEATLPLTPFEGNYYKWSDFRSHYLEKLNSYKD